jgi:predicted metalloprotease
MSVGGDTVDADPAADDDHRAFLLDAIVSIEKYWADTYPQVYEGEYRPLSGGVHGHRPDNDDPLPSGCDFDGDYADVEENAFYCADGDFIVFDDEVLMPTFADEFGVAVVGVVMAHEWGHVIQSPVRNDILYSSRITTLELQADCFAGAWAAHARANGVGGRRFTDRDITASLLGLVQLGDRPGDRPTDESAHGSAFDRVSAFQDGFLGGAEPCVDYEWSEPVPLQFGFTVEELNRPNPSDFPFDDEMFALLTDDLDLFWSAVVSSRWTTPDVDLDEGETTCDSMVASTLGIRICPDDRRLLVDVDVMRDVYVEMPGDFAVGYLLAVGFADLVQTSLDLVLEGEGRHLLNDCLAGAWSGDILPLNVDPLVPPSESAPRVSLSPGDLDEAIRTMIAIGDSGADVNERGSPFEKVDAYRQGVFFGVDACLG